MENVTWVGETGKAVCLILGCVGFGWLLPEWVSGLKSQEVYVPIMMNIISALSAAGISIYFVW